MYAHDTTLLVEGEEELKSLLMEVKEESEKTGLKLNLKKPKIMASGPVTSWQIVGEKVETEVDFIFFDSKITVDSDCSHEIKRRFLFGEIAVINLGSVLKSRDITLLNKGPSSQSYGFSIRMDVLCCCNLEAAFTFLQGGPLHREPNACQCYQSKQVRVQECQQESSQIFCNLILEVTFITVVLFCLLEASH